MAAAMLEAALPSRIAETYEYRISFRMVSSVWPTRAETNSAQDGYMNSKPIDQKYNFMPNSSTRDGPAPVTAPYVCAGRPALSKRTTVSMPVNDG